MSLQSCFLVSGILKMMMVWNSVGETRPEATWTKQYHGVPALVNLILTKRYAPDRRAKTAKNGAKPAKDGANHFQKPDSYPGFYGRLIATTTALFPGISFYPSVRTSSLSRGVVD